MKKINKELIISNLKEYAFSGAFFATLTILVLYSYGNIFVATYEATFGKSLFTSAEDDCRIENLAYLSKKSNGTGEVYLLNIYHANEKIYHLIVCNNSNELIDKNNIVLSATCNFDELMFNSQYVSETVKYKKLARLIVNNHTITKTILYKSAINDSFEVTVRGIEYTKIFLKTLKQ